MKKNYPTVFFTTLFFFTLTTAFAQFPMGVPTTAIQVPKGNVKVTGILIDSSSLKAVEYASIALYKISNGQAVDGTVSDEKGKFSFSKIEAGEYKVLISFLGYQTKTIDKLNWTKGQEFDLGAIKLSPVVKNLDEVTITGTKRWIAWCTTLKKTLLPKAEMLPMCCAKSQCLRWI